MTDTNTNTQAPEECVNEPVQPLGPYDFAALTSALNSWVREVE